MNWKGLLTGLTRVALTEAYYALVGPNNGTDDASSALTIALSGGKWVAVCPGTYLLNSSFTFTTPLLFLGGILKPANGVALTFSVPPILADGVQGFDLSLGGTVTGAGVSGAVDVAWYGAEGAGSVAAACALATASPKATGILSSAGSGGWKKVSEGITGQLKFGFSTPWGNATSWGYPGSDTSTAMDTMGCLAVRDGAPWYRLEPTLGGGYGWTNAGPSYADSDFANLHATGICKVFYDNSVALFPPSGVSAAPYTTTHDLNAMASVVTESVNHWTALGYGSKLRLGLGNEWNGTVFSAAMTGAQYYTMLATFYDTIKAVNPDVLVGGPVGSDLDWTGGYTAWLDSYLATDWANKSDLFIHHMYDSASGGAPQLSPEEMTFRCELIHSKVLRHRPDVPIMIGETGWYTLSGTYKITEQLQAQYYTRYPFLLRSLPNLETVIFYELGDSDAGGWGVAYTLYGNSTKAAKVPFTTTMAYINAASTGVRYRHQNGTSVAVCMETNYGKQYALWDTAGTVNVPLEIVCASSGTLVIANMMDGSTTTTSLAAGKQFKSVPIGVSSVVLYVYGGQYSLPLDWHIAGMSS